MCGAGVTRFPPFLVSRPINPNILGRLRRLRFFLAASADAASGAPPATSADAAAAEGGALDSLAKLMLLLRTLGPQWQAIGHEQKT